MDTTHLRIRTYDDHDMDLEKFIKNLERQYKFDFRLLPEWKKIIEIMNLTQANIKSKIKDAANRKHDIIENINTEYSRLSPFQLTDRLARTAKQWRFMKPNLKKRKVSLKEDIASLGQELIVIHEHSVDESEIKSTTHPNTEVIESKARIVSKSNLDSEFKSISSPFLPVSICTNHHTLISSIGSKYSDLSYLESNQLENAIKTQTAEDIIENINQRKSIQFYPDELYINGNMYNEQSVKLYITNCSTEYVYIRFKGILDSDYFRTFTIVPATPIKLYPGLSCTFKLILKINKHREATTLNTVVNFKIGGNVYSESKEEILGVPILSRFIGSGRVKATGTIYIPPVYKWHVTAKCGYPKGVGLIYVYDDTKYHLHIRKKYVNFITPEKSIESIEVVSPEIVSLSLDKEEAIGVHNEVLKVNRKTTNFIELVNNEDTLIKTADLVTLLLDDLLNIALEPFVFRQTYLRLLPKSKRVLQVYFTQPDHIGFYHTYYDLEFRDFNTNETIITRTIKVFAEVLPHPITIKPQLLDMSQSPITFGCCKDFIKITNDHKIHPVTIKIKTTTKMKRIFKITPMDTLIPAKSSVNLEVCLCLKQNNAENSLSELTYFTIKIIVCGHKTIYSNVPPLFYEIVAPCAREFKQIYGRKYFRDGPESHK